MSAQNFITPENLSFSEGHISRQQQLVNLGNKISFVSQNILRLLKFSAIAFRTDHTVPISLVKYVSLKRQQRFCKQRRPHQSSVFTSQRIGLIESLKN